MLLACMHLIAHPVARRIGGNEVRSLELPGVVKQPTLDNGCPDPRYHNYSDASNASPEGKNITGIVQMFGGTSFDNVWDDLNSPASCKHTSIALVEDTR